jgi:hypothetical protein
MFIIQIVLLQYAIRMMIQIKRKTEDTTMLEQLQNPIEKYVGLLIKIRI